MAHREDPDNAGGTRKKEPSVSFSDTFPSDGPGGPDARPRQIALVRHVIIGELDSEALPRRSDWNTPIHQPRAITRASRSAPCVVQRRDVGEQTATPKADVKDRGE